MQLLLFKFWNYQIDVSYKYRKFPPGTTTDFVSSYRYLMLSQPVITCLKLTIEALEQGVKYVHS